MDIASAIVLGALYWDIINPLPGQQEKVVIEAIQRVYDAEARPLTQMEMSVATDLAVLPLHQG